MFRCHPPNYFLSLPIFTVLLFNAAGVFAAERDGNTFGLTNFAFSSYLGTGFYTTSGQNVFVLQLPFEHTIKEKSDIEAGWVLNLPVTVGFLNFDNAIIEDIPGLTDVGTITFLPGLEFQYPVTPNWTLIPFADYGFARDFNFKTNVLILGTGVKSLFNLHLENTMITLGNRFLYARENNRNTSQNADYTLIETGLNIRINSGHSISEEPVYSNLYYINFYYPDNLVFFEQTENPIRVGLEHEIGITFSNLPNFLFFEKTEFGIGVRFGNNINVYRLVFGAPF